MIADTRRHQYVLAPIWCDFVVLDRFRCDLEHSRPSVVDQAVSFYFWHFHGCQMSVSDIFFVCGIVMIVGGTFVFFEYARWSVVDQAHFLHFYHVHTGDDDEACATSQSFAACTDVFIGTLLAACFIGF